jgi:hypothetical protein
VRLDARPVISAVCELRGVVFGWLKELVVKWRSSGSTREGSRDIALGMFISFADHTGSTTCLSAHSGRSAPKEVLDPA